MPKMADNERAARALARLDPQLVDDSDDFDTGDNRLDYRYSFAQSRDS
jgi:hypothetical protein